MGIQQLYRIQIFYLFLFLFIFSSSVLAAETPPPNLRKKIIQTKSPYYGFQVGYVQNQNATTLTSSSSVSMTGTSSVIEGFYNYPLLQNYEVSGRFGYNPFTATGISANPALCANGSCTVNVSYLNTDILLKYATNFDPVNLWVGVGVGILYPIKKESNLIDSADLSLTQRISVAFGIAYAVGSNYIIPVELSYCPFSSNVLIQMTQINLKIGFGLRL